MTGHLTSEGLNPRLTGYERAALEWLLRPASKGGGGWHRKSQAGEQAAAILAAGATRSPSDENLLNIALRDQERAARAAA